MDATAVSAGAMLDEMIGYVDEYLADGGPLWMLEHGVGGDDARLEFGGRPMFPERLHVVALVIDATTALLADVESFARATAEELRGWNDATDPGNIAATRARLEGGEARHS